MRSIEFDPTAFEDLAWWAEQDRSQAIRIVRLVRHVQRDPFSGIGKPEQLKQARVGGVLVAAHRPGTRLVYQVLPEKIRNVACPYHY